MAVKWLKTVLKSMSRGFFEKQKGYNPEEFFRRRHQKYGFDLRSVGNCTLSHDENKQQYERAGLVLLDVLCRETIRLDCARILDIGCGTGFYAGLIRNKGAKNYLGLDIMDDRLSILSEQFPGYSFRKADVTVDRIGGLFDLILMLDVTQHIVDDHKFSQAMQNIRSHLADGGVFIVTSWLSEHRIERTYYEVARPMSYYKREFGHCHFGQPVPFRDKFIFSIKKATPPPGPGR